MKLSEKDFQQQIIDLAHIYGWRIAHFRHAWSQDGRRCMTPVQADGKGWPDLVMVKGKRVIIAEVKSDTGKPTPEQQEWLDALRQARMEVFLWRPKDWDTIQETITK